MNTADRDGLLVSLIQSNFFGAGCGLRVDEWGINLHNRGSAFNFDDGHPNAIGPRQDAAAHADPRRSRCATAGRGSCSGARAGTARRRPISQLLTRMLVDGDDPQAAITAPRFTIDPETGARHDRGPLRPGVDRRPPRRAATRSTSCRRYRHGPGIAHAIECLDERLPRRLRSARRRRRRRSL